MAKVKFHLILPQRPLANLTNSNENGYVIELS